MPCLTPPEPLPGSLVIAGGGKLPDEVRNVFLKLAGGDKTRLVVIPTASANVDRNPDSFLEPWKALKLASLQLLHARSPAQAAEPTFSRSLQEATGVWISGGEQQRLADTYLGTPVLTELRKLLQRGGVVGGTSAGAAILSGMMIAGGKEQPAMTRGFALLPAAIIDQHFLKRNRGERLLAAVKQHPGRFGLGIDEETAVVVQGRNIGVVGKSEARICLSPSATRPVVWQTLKAGAKADLVALTRAAIARSQPPFPPKKAADPIVPKGTLIIVGGGGMPKGLWERFIAEAGGPEGRIVVIPTALGDNPPPEPGELKALRKFGAKNIKVLHARTTREANELTFLAELKQAKGLWFSGGRQWRLVDSYLDTQAHREMRGILERGGVIAGSSAGASIQSEYMPRGDPLGNLTMMAEGYERGLGFLPGTAVDQHFFKRQRTKDMTALMATYPQLLGIGIDETTAIIVRGSVAEVVGVSKVAFYNRRQKTEPGQPDYLALTAGQRYDLVKRAVVVP